jgi:hypothetical protein
VAQLHCDECGRRIKPSNCNLRWYTMTEDGQQQVPAFFCKACDAKDRRYVRWMPFSRFVADLVQDKTEAARLMAILDAL